MTIAMQTVLPKNAILHPDTKEVEFFCTAGSYFIAENEVNEETIELFTNEDALEDFILSRESSEQGTRVPIGTF